MLSFYVAEIRFDRVVFVGFVFETLFIFLVYFAYVGENFNYIAQNIFLLNIYVNYITIFIESLHIYRNYAKNFYFRKKTEKYYYNKVLGAAF